MAEVRIVITSNGVQISFDTEDNPLSVHVVEVSMHQMKGSYQK